MTNLSGDALQQLQVDTRGIVAEVERVTGRKSNWSGRVVLGVDLDSFGLPLYLGAKPWNCDIVLHQSLLALPSRYSTLIHEAFHSVSVGLNEAEYRAFKGYEEGVVEQCTRLCRLEILASIGLPPPSDARTSYSIQIALLEHLRARAQKAERDFYFTLLQTPLQDREEVLIQWIQSTETIRTRQQIELDTLRLRTGLKR